MDTKKIAIVVNARLSSSRCPNKHIRDLGGTTLIDECLRKIDLLTGVQEKYLATGDELLIEKIKKYPSVELLSRREESYAKGQVPFKIAFEHYNKVAASHIMIINPCQPFVPTQVYQDSIDWFNGSSADGAASVIKERNYFFFDDGRIANFDKSSRLCSVSGPAMLKCSHTFMFFNKQFFINHDTLWSNTAGSPEPYIIPDNGLYDVDTEENFLIASNMMRVIKNV